MKNVCLVAALATLLLSSRQTAGAGYVVAMGDNTPLFNLVPYDLHIPQDGTQMFFRNLLGSGDSVAVVRQPDAGQLGDAVELVYEFFQRIPNVASKRIIDTVTDSNLAGADLVVVGKQPDDFVSSEVAAMQRVIGQGANLLVVNEPGSTGGGGAVTNRLLADLGVNMRIAVDRYIFSRATLTGDNIRKHPLTTGVANFYYGGAWGVSGGTPLFVATEGVPLVAAVFVPEPATATLLAIAFVALARRRYAH